MLIKVLRNRHRSYYPHSPRALCISHLAHLTPHCRSLATSRNKSISFLITTSYLSLGVAYIVLIGCSGLGYFLILCFWT